MWSSISLNANQSVGLVNHLASGLNVSPLSQPEHSSWRNTRKQSGHKTLSSGFAPPQFGGIQISKEIRSIEVWYGSCVQETLANARVDNPCIASLSEPFRCLVWRNTWAAMAKIPSRHSMKAPRLAKIQRARGCRIILIHHVGGASHFNYVQHRLHALHRRSTLFN